MEYQLGIYVRSNGKILTSSDGFKYVKYKVKGNHVYLRCVLSKKGCKGTSKLDIERDLIYPNSIHNHPIQAYNSEIYELKNHCKKIARGSQNSLRKIFNDETRTHPFACEISFNECVSAMYRARRKSQPMVPLNAVEFSEMQPGSEFTTHHKFTISVGVEIAVVFYSEPMANALSEINRLQFDGTFYTVPSQFYQLWTIFLNIDRYTIPSIHCLMTFKSQELYTAIVQRISTSFIDFKPTISISDWEPAPRNSFKEIYPTIIIHGCWFHYTQCILRKTHKIGLVQNFRENPDLAQYIRQLMALPFLPSSIIRQIYALLKKPELLLNESVKLNNY